jgi:hypothetical protein
MKIMTDIELAWLAGLLEGEGSFINQTSRWRGRRYIYVRVCIQMTDLDIIERVRTVTGVPNKIFEPKITISGRKQMYRFWIDGQKAYDLMTLLRPFMGHRRQGQIDTAQANNQSLSKEARSIITAESSSKSWDKKTGLNNQKRAAIEKDERPVSFIAKEYGVSEPTIRRIRHNTHDRG